jgi:hypothetical protein
MIATLTAIMFIISENQDIISNKILQKGQAISKLNEDDSQIYNYTVFIPISSTDENSNSSENNKSFDETLQLFQKDLVYLVYGKFGVSSNSLLDINVTQYEHLEIARDDIPISKPFVHLLGQTESIPVKSEAGYQLTIQVKPYLNKEQCGPISVTLVYFLDEYLKNAFEKTRKFALVHATGILIIYKDKWYCEISEYQFVSTNKSEDSSSIIVP